jgi:dolichyl-phosphate-mannose-protein mannosyltransferase
MIVVKIKHLNKIVWQYDHLFVFLLMLIILALHFSLITHPTQPIFDEQYYVPAANSILQGEGTDRIEHPPLGQLFIASGIAIFGDNPFGWRVFPIFFGTTGLFIFYLICRRLNFGSKYAFLATFLLAFENLNFIQSGIAMLDVFSLTFMLFSFWFYLRGNYLSCGILIGLATLCKLTGILALPIILLHWLLTNSKNFKQGILPLFLALITFFILMPIFEFMIWHEWLNPLSQVGFIFEANTLATFTGSPSEIISRPWEWLIKPEILTYWIDPHYLAMISPTLWALIIPVIAFTVYKAKKGNQVALFAIVWFTGTYLIWLPISLISDRLSYIYYFYPTEGSVCIAISLIASSLDNLANKPELNNKLMKVILIVVPVYIFLHLGAFILLSPISYWWKLPFCVISYIMARYYLSKRQKCERIDVSV